MQQGATKCLDKPSESAGNVHNARTADVEPLRNQLASTNDYPRDLPSHTYDPCRDFVVRKEKRDHEVNTTFAGGGGTDLEAARMG